jgi:GDP/UDP-N,N'-diacetylbacillosamine 2-epimerase (hydrolysing)
MNLRNRINQLKSFNKIQKICIVTGSRAEYGLLYWLMKEIQYEPDLELQLIATGMHLSPEFGCTYKEIEKDGFYINKKIEMLLSSDTPVSISKSMGLAQISFAEAYDDLKPDIIAVLGDRYEIFSAASAAMIARIPIAHLHGGETTEGAFDEAIRHSITKMSHLHFTATEEYRRRVIQLGEHPDSVFNVGGMGIENIKRLKLLTKKQFEVSINFKLAKKNILVTFHPVTLENSTSKNQFQELLNALDELYETNIIFTKANSDTNGRVINQMIESYVLEKPNTVAFTSLGQLRYLSALQFVDVVVGNSSSGLIEVPSFKIGTINIGNRQKGRIRAKSVIDCKPEKNSIKEAFIRLYKLEFQNSLKHVKNPYGDAMTSKPVINILKNIDLSNILIKKFNDIKF